jgi:hypothetical protein
MSHKLLCANHVGGNWQGGDPVGPASKGQLQHARCRKQTPGIRNASVQVLSGCTATRAGVAAGVVLKTVSWKKAACTDAPHMCPTYSLLATTSR